MSRGACCLLGSPSGASQLLIAERQASGRPSMRFGGGLVLSRWPGFNGCSCWARGLPRLRIFGGSRLVSGESGAIVLRQNRTIPRHLRRPLSTIEDLVYDGSPGVGLFFACRSRRMTVASRHHRRVLENRVLGAAGANPAKIQPRGAADSVFRPEPGAPLGLDPLEVFFFRLTTIADADRFFAQGLPPRQKPCKYAG